MLATRVASALVLMPLVVAVAWVGEPWLSLLVGLVVFLALVELIGLLDAAGYQPPPVAMLALGMTTAIAGLLAVNRGSVGGPLGELLRVLDRPGASVAALVLTTLALAVVAFTRSDPRTGFLTWATTSFAIAYVGLLAPLIVLVAHLAPAGGSPATAVGWLGLRSGVAWTGLLLLAVWSYDIGAYFTGRRFGRHRLIEHLSAGKTVEGLAGGLLAATAACLLGAVTVGLPPWHAVLLGPLLGLGAQAGDLAASLIKRAAGRKESGFLIPGHGGVLDRVDSFLFAGPVLAGYAILATGATA